MRLARRSVLLAAASIGLPAHRAWAAGYPARPVKIVVPVAPSGPTDVMARVIAAHLGERLGGSFVVENRPGAGSNTGMGVVARADPDGYTLLVASSALVVSPSLFKHVPYDPSADFEPITELGSTPNVFVADPKSGIASIGDLVARAKASPNTLNYGSSGIGTTPHLSGEFLKRAAGIEITHVPFFGGGPAVEAVLASTTPFACVTLQPALPFLLTGALTGLAVTSRTRWPDLPHVPTMAESGYPAIVTDTMQAFLAPARTPSEIVGLLAAASISILRDPATEAQLRTNGFEVIANGPGALRARIAEEVPKWRALIAEAGIQPR